MDKIKDYQDEIKYISHNQLSETKKMGFDEYKRYLKDYGNMILFYQKTLDKRFNGRKNSRSRSRTVSFSQENYINKLNEKLKNAEKLKLSEAEKQKLYADIIRLSKSVRGKGITKRKKK